MKALNLAMAAAVVLLVTTTLASADVILTFGQTNDGNTLVATANGAGTVTTIVATDVPVNVTQILGSTPTTADFDLDIASTDDVTPLGSGGFQHYAGSFSITSGPGGTGTNFLSGNFTDLVLGTGGSAVLSASAPPDTINFTSDVITALDLPRAISLSFANVTDPITVDNLTFGSFTSSVSGDFSAAAIPEPGTTLLLAAGLLGLGMIRTGRRSAA